MQLAPLKERLLTVAVVIASSGSGGALGATMLRSNEAAELKLIRESLLSEIRLSNQQLGQLSAQIQDHETRLRLLEHPQGRIR